MRLVRQKSRPSQFVRQCPLVFLRLLMKVYNLSCEHGHRFEGWFSSEEDYLAQSATVQIECPVCESRAITKLPSAPRLNLNVNHQPEPDPMVAIQAKAAELLQQVIANTEDVGERFAEEARRMHYNETPDRAIRGVATLPECEALVEEGIDITPLPFAVPLKHPVQ